MLLKINTLWSMVYLLVFKPDSSLQCQLNRLRIWRTKTDFYTILYRKLSQNSQTTWTTSRGNRSSNVNIFCLEHFYTIRYNTFLHTFLCSTTYQKLVFHAGIPLIINIGGSEETPTFH